MSLKTFHVFFVCASIVLCFMVGAWALQQYRLAGTPGNLSLAVVFYASGVGLVFYGLRFVRKIRELGI
ncbi:MAG TPA: hypothetical protein QGG47_04925 [Acidobacteriota bacterium]|nr:hypothetical protein [Acidobacteriota bacterium]